MVVTVPTVENLREVLIAAVVFQPHLNFYSNFSAFLINTYPYHYSCPLVLGTLETMDITMNTGSISLVAPNGAMEHINPELQQVCLPLLTQKHFLTSVGQYP